MQFSRLWGKSASLPEACGQQVDHHLEMDRVRAQPLCGWARPWRRRARAEEAYAKSPVRPSYTTSSSSASQSAALQTFCWSSGAGGPQTSKSSSMPCSAGPRSTLSSRSSFAASPSGCALRLPSALEAAAGEGEFSLSTSTCGVGDGGGEERRSAILRALEGIFKQTPSHLPAPHQEHHFKSPPSALGQSTAICTDGGEWLCCSPCGRVACGSSGRLPRRRVPEPSEVGLESRSKRSTSHGTPPE